VHNNNRLLKWGVAVRSIPVSTLTNWCILLLVFRRAKSTEMSRSDISPSLQKFHPQPAHLLEWGYGLSILAIYMECMAFSQQSIYRSWSKAITGWLLGLVIAQCEWRLVLIKTTPNKVNAFSAWFWVQAKLRPNLLSKRHYESLKPWNAPPLFCNLWA